MNATTDLLVFSHLRWDFVYQRPQHILSRLAQQRRVFYIEEPLHVPGAARHIEMRAVAPNNMVCRLITPDYTAGFFTTAEDYTQAVVTMVREAYQIGAYDCWFYTPMAVPVLDELTPRAVIYDCMDDLASFLHAPPELRTREARLLDCADLVLTGGKSLYESKRDRHHNVHCFPSSVDVAHFTQAQQPLTAPADQERIPLPRLGFYGVIDERLDIELVAALADAHREWQIILIGPIVKIDPATLPRRSNLYYLGGKSYDQLPWYLSGWDVCLLPFAINKATRHISPTKTLEYLAAGKPVVSTAIVDVVNSYRNIVSIAEDTAAFIAACEQALCESASQRHERLTGAGAAVAATSWDSTVAAMTRLIELAALRSVA